MVFKNLLGPLLRSGIIRSVSLLASATAIGQLLLLAAMPLLTRIYMPADFGVFAVFNGIMASILVISSLRYEFAVPLPKSETSARALLILSLGLNVATAIVTTGLVLLLRDRAATYFEAPGLATLLFLLPAIILGAGSYKALNYWAIRTSNFRLIARTKIDQSISNLAVQIVAGLAGWGAFGLAAGQFFGYTAGTLRLARGTGLRRADFTDSRLAARMRGLARRHSRFPKYDVPAALVNSVGVQLPNIALAALFSTSVAGFYMVADRVLSAPLALVGQAIGQVLLADGREGARTGSLAASALRIAAGLAALSILPAIALFLAGEWLFAIVLGELWREAGIYASWMVPGLCVQFIYSSISVVLMATDGQRVNLGIHLALLLAKAAVLYASALHEDPLSAVIGLAVVNVVGYGAAIFIVVRHARQYASAQHSGKIA